MMDQDTMWWNGLGNDRSTLRRSLKWSLVTVLGGLLGVTSLSAQNGDRPGETQAPVPEHIEVPPAPVLSPQRALTTFHLEPGFRVELVASEPLIHDPVAMEFDAQGRIWVVEMRGYMPNADGVGEDVPNGRVVCLTDEDGDGMMDRSTVFLDGLRMPRAIGLVGDGVLVAEPTNLWFWRDTDGDGRGDEKTLVHDGYGNQENPEHNANGLMTGMDNWIYSANFTTRFRYRGGTWESEPTVFRGQWGITQDNAGRQFFDTNSDQIRGDLVPAEYLIRNANFPRAAGSNVRINNDQRVWPIRVTTGINRGYQSGMLKDGKLTKFTAACGPVIYRGDQFPSEYVGNAFVAEPSGNLIKRNVLTEKGGMISGSFAYEDREFMTSTDERFRPVNLYNGPDGALYVVDFYRGIIQHRIYMTSFLRKQVDERGLANPIGLGRIWRVVHEGKPRQVATVAETSDPDLVKQLGHSNGWTRDAAQKELIRRGNENVASLVRELLNQSQNTWGRLHALWVLEGLGSVDRSDVLIALSDKEPLVRRAGLRFSEPYLESDEELALKVMGLAGDQDDGVLWQWALSCSGKSHPGLESALVEILTKKLDHPYIPEGVLTGLQGQELRFLARLWGHPDWSESSPQKIAFLEKIAGCLVAEGSGFRLDQLLEMAVVQPIAGLWRAEAVLRGLEKTIPKEGSRGAKLKPIRVASEPLAFRLASTSPTWKKWMDPLAPLIVWGAAAQGEEDTGEALTPEQQDQFNRGQGLYLATCGACHQPHGNGQAGLAPPLRESDWTLGSEDRLIRIVLQGVRGKIEVLGTEYEMEMPALYVLSDEQIADVLSYVRREWGHRASFISSEKVARVRAETENRFDAWTAEELKKIP